VPINWLYPSASVATIVPLIIGYINQWPICYLLCRKHFKRAGAPSWCIQLGARGVIL